MASIDDLIDEYLGVAVSPADMRELAMMQVKDASVQDDAVQNAVRNHHGIEQAGRSALEDYLRMADEQAAAESQRALDMAQQRLNALDQNASLLASTVGLGKEGKQKLASIESERQAILKAFPQLGKTATGEGDEGQPAAFDIKKMLAEKDYSPETIAKMFKENDRDVWDQALRTGDLDLYQAMLDAKLGDLPEGMAEKMRFVIGGMPDTSKALKLDEKYARLRGVIGETQGDLKKKDRDEKAAAAKKKAEEQDKKQTEADVAEMKRALASNNSIGRVAFQTPEFKAKLKKLKAKNLIDAEDELKLKKFVGEF